MRFITLWLSLCFLGKALGGSNHLRPFHLDPQSQHDIAIPNRTTEQELQEQLQGHFLEESLLATSSSRHRQLQRIASICTEDPTPFASSIYVTHIGDGTPFRRADLDKLLTLALTAFNLADAQQCDPTYRTLQGVFVNDVYYTDELDYIRLRYDFNGNCKGCLPDDLYSGIGPLFGGENNNPEDRLDATQTANGATATPPIVLSAAEYSESVALENAQSSVAQGEKPVAAAEESLGTTSTLTSKSKGKGGNNRALKSKPQKQARHNSVKGRRGRPNNNNRRRRQQQLDPSAQRCACNNPELLATGAAGRGPTYSEYGTMFNALVNAARADGSLSGVSYVTEVFEAGVAGQSTVMAKDEPGGGCSAIDNEEFTTTIWIEVTGTGSELTRPEQIPMEVAITETFNEMNLESCDEPKFRLISNVDYIETRPGPDGTTLLMKFDVYGKCVNCDPTSLLLFDTTDVSEDLPTEFRPPSLSQLLSEIQRLSTVPIVVIRPGWTECVCPLNEDKLPFRSPNTGEFSGVLQSSVDTLRAENLLPTFQQVIKVTEGELPPVGGIGGGGGGVDGGTTGGGTVAPGDGTVGGDGTTTTVAPGDGTVGGDGTGYNEGTNDGGGNQLVCTDDAIPFTSTVFADFDGRPSLLEPDEISALELGFKDSYNSLIYDNCDSYYRFIQEVRLIPGISRRRDRSRSRYLQASTGNAANSSDVVNLQSELPSVYMIAGQCRGCPRTSSGNFNLFNDAFRLRKLVVQGHEETYACYSYSSSPKTPLDFLQIDDTSDSSSSAVVMSNEQRHLQECACAPGALPDSPYAPTSEDFIVTYNNKIAEYREQGLVRNVNSVLGLQEVPPYLVEVGFSILYGSLDRMGTPPDSAYPALVDQTSKFYRSRLEAYYNDIPDTSLRSVTITWQSSTLEPDLDTIQVDMIQVDFMAELIFEESGNMPSKQEVVDVMENCDYVEYIVDYLWKLDYENSFRQCHTVLFVGTKQVAVNLSMTLTVRSDRTNVVPDREDCDGLARQLNSFFQNVLECAGLLVMSVESHIGAEDVVVSDNGDMWLDFDATVTFVKDGAPASPDAVMAIIDSADLEVLRTQYLGQATPVGTAVFSDPLAINFANPLANSP